MKLLREFIQLVCERAYDVDDLPKGWVVYIQRESGGMSVWLKQKTDDGLENVPGEAYVYLYEPEGAGDPILPGQQKKLACMNAYEIQLSKAPDKWGPFLYDIALELAGDRGLMSDRLRVSKDARNVWNYYDRSRSDVQSKQLDNPNNQLTKITYDNCQQDSAEDDLGGEWYKSPLSRVYYKHGHEKLLRLKRAGKLVFEHA